MYIFALALVGMYIQIWLIRNLRNQKKLLNYAESHGLREEDTRDRDRWRNLVLGEGKPL
jgi:hypothetical protein